jgi:hypothetical protein
MAAVLLEWERTRPSGSEVTAATAIALSAQIGRIIREFEIPQNDPAEPALQALTRIAYALADGAKAKATLARQRQRKRKRKPAGAKGPAAAANRRSDRTERKKPPGAKRAAAAQSNRWRHRRTGRTAVLVGKSWRDAAGRIKVSYRYEHGRAPLVTVTRKRFLKAFEPVAAKGRR